MKRWITGVVAALTMAVAGAAQAAIIEYNVGGKFAHGTDYAGLFGTANRDLAGVNFLLAFRFDTELGATRTEPGLVHLYGGSYHQALTSPGSAVLTIDGIALPISGDAAGQLLAVENATTMMMAVENTGDYEAVATVLHNGGAAGLAYAGIGACTASDFCDGLIEINSLGPNPGDYTPLFNGVLAPEYISAAGAIPEPHTWALLIIGFGLTGAALRRSLRHRDFDDGRVRVLA